jgi:hypothetical protein
MVAQVFPFPPNFREDVSEIIESKSDILRAYDGTEQRRQVRVKERRGFEYRFSLLNADDCQYLQNLLWSWQNRQFGLPVWTDIVRTSAPQFVGDLVVNADPNERSFIDGGQAIIFQDRYNYEIFDIDALGLNITAVLPLTKAWPAGTPVYPYILGTLPKTIPIQRYTSRVMEGILTFNGDPVSVDPYLPVGTAPVTYAGYEVITTQPNWVRPLDGTFDYEYQTLDSQTGALFNLVTEEFARNTRRYSWTLIGRTAILNFRKFLGRRRGQVKPFWAPSWTEDFQVISNIGASATSITVKRNGFRELLGVDTAHDRVMFRMKNGMVYYRRITAVGLAGDNINSFITIDSSLGTAYTTTQIEAVHMLNLCRFATDKVSLQWKTDTVVTVDTTLTTVPS